MQKLARDYLDELNRRHKKNRKALVAWILLATLVVGTVMGTLSQYGVAMEDGPTCGKEEHTHDDGCYGGDSEEPNCGLDKHTHTAVCYAKSEGEAADQPDDEEVKTPSKPEDPSSGSSESTPASTSAPESSGTETSSGETTAPVTTSAAGGESDPTIPETTKGQEEPDPAESGPVETTRSSEETNPTETTKESEETDPTETTKSPEETTEPVETTITSGEEAEDSQPDTTEYISIKRAEEEWANQGLAAMCMAVDGSLLMAAGGIDLGGSGSLNQPSSPWLFSTRYVGESSNTTGGGSMLLRGLSMGEASRPDQSSDIVTKTENFNLKYQMNFENKTGVAIPAGAVKISIPRALLDKADGSPVNPQDIAAREVTDQLNSLGNPPLNVQGVSFPFCYYIEKRDGRDYLVFYNHKSIENDRSFLWQVLYKDVKLMDIENGKEWNLQPAIEVNAVDTEGNPLKNNDGTDIASVGIIDGRHGQNIAPIPLRGRIDSSASITSVTEKPYYAAGKSYAPGLYTRSQVESFIGGELPEWLEKKDADGKITESHFSDYKYVVWELNIKGKATQPWQLEVTDVPQVAENAGAQCKVVGYSRKDSNNIESGKLLSSVIPGNTVTEGGEAAADSLTTDYSRSESWSCSYYVVTAYPIADSAAEGTVLKNSVTVRAVPKWPSSAMEPSFENRPEQTADASWVYQDYHWVYGNDGMSGVKKNDYSETPTTGRRYEKSYSGWLNAYIYAASSDGGKQPEDYGNLPFYVQAALPGYDYTHIVNKQGDTESKGTAGTYIPGTSYTLITTDDLLYASREESSSAGLQPMNYRDYYYTGVTVTQTDTGYDVWEDREVNPAGIPEDEYEALKAAGLTETPVKIYAMYGADENGTPYSADASDALKWTEVKDDSFDFRMNDQTGTMTYIFGSEILKRQPWRVKVVHETTHYKTTCEIRTELCLRHDSPVMWGDKLKGINGLLTDAEMSSDELTPVRLWGLAGAFGITTTGRGGTAAKNKVYAFSSTEAEEESLANVNKALRDLYWEEIKEEYKCTNAADVETWNNSTADNPRYMRSVIYPMGAYKSLRGFGKDAAATKEALRVYPDPAASESRMLVDYFLTAYDGYEVSRPEDQQYMRQAGVPSPGQNRKAVEFYDLLPLGMSLDPNSVKAGQLQRLDAGYQNRPNDLNESQTQVFYRIVDTNHHGTGRTLVCFRIDFSGEDAAIYYANGKWAEAWGVSFRAYYEKKDLASMGSSVNANLSAFMPATDDPGYGSPLIGRSDQISKDNGQPPEGLEPGSAQYNDLNKIATTFGPNINKNEENDVIANVLYASDTFSDTVAQYGEVGVVKRVRADVNSSGLYAEQTVVGPGKDYTYDITVNSDGTSGTKDIIVFDQLESAEGSEWKGHFCSVNLVKLRAMGIEPVVYYGTEGAQIPEKKESLSAVLNDLDAANSNWHKSENGALPGGITADQVKTVAVYFGKKGDNDQIISYTFPNETMSASFEIRMKALTEEEIDVQNKDILNNKNAWAKNGTYFYKSLGDEFEGDDSASNAAVRISNEGILRIAKEFDDPDEVPASVRNDSFTFTVYEPDGRTPFAFRQYRLYAKDAKGQYQLKSAQKATGSNGSLELQAGELAEFIGLTADAENIVIKEKDSVFWQSETAKAQDKETLNPAQDGTEGIPVWKHTVTNKYRPPLYFQKKTGGIPAGLSEAAQEKINNSRFTFVIKVEGEPLEEGTKFRYAQNVRTDGGVPVWDTESGVNGVGTVGEGGTFTLKAGQIAVFFPGAVETEYEIEETESYIVKIEGGKEVRLTEPEDFWFRQDPDSNPKASGSLTAKGSDKAITNYYKWKDLYLTKNITNQEQREYDANPVTFTFRITKKAGTGSAPADVNTAVSGVRWEVLEKVGSPAQIADVDKEKFGNTSGTTDGYGKFTCACGGRTVRLTGLEADADYEVKEIEIGGVSIESEQGGVLTTVIPDTVLYEPNQASQTVKMPVQGDRQTVSITNDYLMRPLSITKTVAAKTTPENQAAISGTPFQIKIEVGNSEKNLSALEGEDIVYTITNSDGSKAASYTKAAQNAGETVEEVSAITDPVTGDPIFTIEEGGFIWLRHGQTADFKCAARAGQFYRVSEIQEDSSEEGGDLETNAVKFTQIFPTKDDDGNTGVHTGSFPKTGTTKLSFVNGSNAGGILYISKNYVTASEDPTIKGYEEQFISQLPSGSAIRGKGGDLLRLEIQKDGVNRPYFGEITRLRLEEDPIDRGEMHLVETPDSWGTKSDPELCEIHPGEVIMVELGEDCSYELTEAAESRHRIEYAEILVKKKKNVRGLNQAGGQGDQKDAYFEVSQIIPENDGSVTGTVETKPVAAITNQVSYINFHSQVVKWMTNGSTEVPVGAKLVWKLEKKVGGKWQPASGERYVTFDGGDKLKMDGEYSSRREKGSGITCDRVLTTGDGGRITLYKTENGWPGAGFPDIEVKVNQYDGAGTVIEEGAYRLVELPEESDKEWGLLAGYGAVDRALWFNPEGYKYGSMDIGYEYINMPYYHDGKLLYSRNSSECYTLNYGEDMMGEMSLQYDYAFVNSNAVTPVEIAKQMEIAPEDSSATFTMMLRQVISCKNTWKTEGGKRVEVKNDPSTYVTEPRSGIDYEIYRGNTKEGDGTTGDNGEIILQAGQHARLMLPENTLWTVTEYLEPIYSLQDIASTTDGSAVITELPVGSGTGTAAASNNRTMQIDLAEDEPVYTITFDWGDGTETVKKVAPGQRVMFPEVRTQSKNFPNGCKPGDREYMVTGWGLRKGRYDKAAGDYGAGTTYYGATSEESEPWEIIPTSDMTLYAIREYEVRYSAEDKDGSIEGQEWAKETVYATGKEVTIDLLQGPKDTETKHFTGWKRIGAGTTGTPQTGSVTIDWSDPNNIIEYKKWGNKSLALGAMFEAAWEGTTEYEVEMQFGTGGKYSQYKPDTGKTQIRSLQGTIGESITAEKLLNDEQIKNVETFDAENNLEGRYLKAEQTSITLTGNLYHDKFVVQYIKICPHAEPWYHSADWKYMDNGDGTHTQICQMGYNSIDGQCGGVKVDNYNNHVYENGKSECEYCGASKTGSN